MGEEKRTRLSTEELRALITKTVAEAVGEAIPGVVEKLKPRKAEATEVKSDIGSKERMGQYFRGALFGIDKVDDPLVRKALGEGTPSAGGYLVPDEYRAELVKRLPELSELLPHVRQIPVATDAGSMPSLATDISVSWAEAEAATFAETDPVFGTLAWTIFRCQAYTAMSRELVSDAAPKIADVVTDLFVEAMAAEMDKVIAIGDGATQPLGLFSCASITSTSVGTITFAKLLELEFTLAKKYRKRARWVLNNVNMRRIQALTDDNGQPLFKRDPAQHGAGTILGYPVAQQDDLPDTDVLFGDLSYYLLFDREQVGVEATSVGGAAFLNHLMYMKTWLRCDGKLSLDIPSGPFIRGDNIDG